MSNDVQFNLRIPAELKQQISDTAKVNGRSINAEAQLRLEESFTKKDKVRITDYDGLSESAMSIELEYVTIGLMKSKYHEVELQDCHNGQWMLIYHALRCMIDESSAQILIGKGCTKK